MQSLTSSMVELYRDASLIWARIYNDTNAIEKAIKEGEAGLPTIVDCVLLLKKSKERLEDATKEHNKAIDTLSKIACLLHATEGKGGTIYGELCSATARTGSAPPSFKRRDNPELFDEIMMYFGFSKEAAEKEMARLYYPAVETHLQELQAEGKPLPECLKGMQLRPTFALTCRCSSGVDLEEVVLKHTKEREKENVDRNNGNVPGLGAGSPETTVIDDNPF